MFTLNAKITKALLYCSFILPLSLRASNNNAIHILVTYKGEQLIPESLASGKFSSITYVSVNLFQE